MPPLKTFTDITKIPRRGPILPAILAVFGLILAGGAYLIFRKPEAVPAELLFEGLFPRGTAVRELQDLDLNTNAVLDNPIFQQLKEHGPLPLQLPPLGRENPFIR